MTNDRMVLSQLKLLGLKFRILGRTEVKRLCGIVRDDEEVKHCIYGFSNDGPVLFVATDQRLIMIDKRFLFMNQDNVRYDVIKDLELRRGMLASTVVFKTNIKKFEFKTYADARLRRLHEFIETNRDFHKKDDSLEMIELGIGELAVPFKFRTTGIE